LAENAISLVNWFQRCQRSIVDTSKMAQRLVIFGLLLTNQFYTQPSCKTFWLLQSMLSV